MDWKERYNFPREIKLGMTFKMKQSENSRYKKTYFKTIYTLTEIPDYTSYSYLYELTPFDNRLKKIYYTLDHFKEQFCKIKVNKNGLERTI